MTRPLSLVLWRRFHHSLMWLHTNKLYVSATLRDWGMTCVVSVRLIGFNHGLRTRGQKRDHSARKSNYKTHHQSFVRVFEKIVCPRQYEWTIRAFSVILVIRIISWLGYILNPSFISELDHNIIYAMGKTGHRRHFGSMKPVRTLQVYSLLQKNRSNIAVHPPIATGKRC